MEEPQRPNSGPQKKQVLLNIGRVSTHGGGGIGGFILLGGALATAAFASAFIIGKKTRCHRNTRIPPPPPPTVNQKDELDTEVNKKQEFTFLDSNKHSSETTKEIDSQSLVSDEEHGIEIHGIVACDSQASEQTLCSITPTIPENSAISDEDVSHLPEEQKTLLPLEIENVMMAHNAKIQPPREAAIDENAITKECQGFEKVKEEGESRDDRATELMGEGEMECEDTEESKGNYLPEDGLKCSEEGTIVSELQGKDGQEESILPVSGSPIGEHENVNRDEKQGFLSSEVIHEEEAIEGAKKDQIEHIEDHLVKEHKECDELDEEINMWKDEEEKDDRISERNNEEKGQIDNVTRENRQIGDSEEDVQILEMHLPEEESIFPEEMEVSEEDVVNEENVIMKESQGFEKGEGGESMDDRATELMGEINEMECEDAEESKEIYVPEVGLKFSEEGIVISELQGKDGQESILPVAGSPIIKHENVNGGEKQGFLSNEVGEIIHEYEAIEEAEKDQVERIDEDHLVKECKECDELDDEIIMGKDEEAKYDRRSEGNNEEKGQIDNSTPENRQLGDLEEYVQILEMHLPEEELIFPDEMEVSEEDAVNEEIAVSFCQHNDTEDEVEKIIENEVEGSSETIDAGIATTKDEEDIIDDTDGDEDLSDEAEESTEGTADSSMESDLGGIWPAEIIEEPSIETQQLKLVNQELEGKIQEDTTVKRGKHECQPHKIIADKTQITNGKFSSAKTYIENVMDLATLKHYSTNSGTRKLLVVAIPVLSSVACSWFVGLSFDKLCLVVLLTIILSKSMIVK